MNFFARLWRKAFFSEINPVIELGATRALQAGDMPRLPTELDPRHNPIREDMIQWSTGPKLMRSLLKASARIMIWPLVFYFGNAALNLADRFWSIALSRACSWGSSRARP